MAKSSSLRKASKIYDPASGKSRDLEKWVLSLGLEAVAKKYGVQKTTVQKWVRGLHRPARKTVSQPSKRLL